MPLAMQAKLLRVIEDRVVERLGGEKGIPVDVRIISATNIDFKKEIEKGTFRHDLYYRLNVIPIRLLPLRERKEDIPLFVQYFLNKFNQELNKKVKGFTPDALAILTNYDWPGNVRELQNFIERLVVLAQGSIITKEDLQLHSASELSETKGQTLKDALAYYEKQLIKKALIESGNNRSLAAKALGIPRSTLNSRIEALGIA